MLLLISTEETEDLVFSMDSAVKLANADREPVRALLKRDATLTKDRATVFTVRPIKSREMIRVINASAVSTTEGLVRAAEIGICSITDAVTKGGKVKSAGTPQEVDALIDELPHPTILATGAYLIEASTLPYDPTEASA